MKAQPWQRLRRAIVGVAAASLLTGTGLAVAPVAGASASLTTVTLSLPAKVGGYLPFYLTIAKHFYKKHGINLQIEIMHPNTAVAEVEAGKLDLVGGVTESDTAILEAHAPLKTFAVFDQRLDWVTVAPKSITSVQQLVGKTIVGEAANSTANVILDKMLEAKGVQPSQVNVVNVRGADTARFALIAAGKAVATDMEYSVYLSLPSTYHILYNDSTFLGTFGGFAGQTAWAAAHAKVLHNLITATTEATHYILDHKAKTISVIESTYTLNKNQATKLWNFMKPDWAFGKPTKAAEKANLANDEVVLKLSSQPKLSEIANWKYVTKS